MSNDDRFNHRLLYQSLLARTDEESREDFEVDPRVAQYASRNAGDENVDTYTPLGGVHTTMLEESDNIVIAKEPNIEHYETDVPVQAPPSTKLKRTTVIIDSAQRDWVQQSNAYSNIFSFGTQAPTSGVGQMIRFYFNNEVVPFSAYDTPYPNPTTLVTYVPIQLANNKPHILNLSEGTQNITLNQQFLNNGLLANTWGWRLVVSQTGQYKHTPEPIVSTDRIIYFPTYNPRETRGALIGVEYEPKAYSTHIAPFSSQLAISNVVALKLVRATLPLRRFDSYNPAVFYDVTNPDQAQSAGTSTNSFNSQPYIVMTIQNMKGQYYGAGQVIQNAFTVLVQNQRSVLDAEASSYLNQFQDYYSWSEETFEFDPPLAQLSNAAIALSNNVGQPFVQSDDLNGLFMTFGRNTNNISSGFCQGNVVFNITRNPTNYQNWGLNNGTVNYFGTNEIRVGDEILSYAPVITSILSTPGLPPILRPFFQTLLTNTLLVTRVFSTNTISGYGLEIGNNLYSYGTSFSAIIKPSSFSNMIAINTMMGAIGAAGNGLHHWGEVTTNPGASGPPPSDLSGLNYFVIPPSPVAYRYFQDGSINTIYLQPDLMTLSSGTPHTLPILNMDMQSTYAFEVTSSVADTTQMKKIIPN